MLTYDEYMKQSKDYCDALEIIKQELAHRRSELSNLAQQTVANLESKIPSLQAKINTLTAEVSRLDTLIATKTKQSEYDENYWKSHYEGLEVTLNKAHDARTAMFKGKDDQYAIRDNAHKENLKDLESREQALKDGFVHLSESSNALDIIRINL